MVTVDGIQYCPRCPEHAESIEGMTWVFGMYPDYTDRNEKHVLSLWGTPRFYRAPYDSPEQDMAWKEVCNLLGQRTVIDGEMSNLPEKALMDQEGDKWVAYSSYNLDWWTET